MKKGRRTRYKVSLILLLSLILVLIIISGKYYNNIREKNVASNVYVPKETYISKIANETNNKYSICVVGDSLANGQGASNESTQWVSMVERNFINKSIYDGTGYEFITNFKYKLSSMDIEYTGNYSFQDYSDAEGELNIVLQPGASIKFDRNFDNLYMTYNQSPNNGKIQISLNGDISETVDLKGNTENYKILSRKYDLNKYSTEIRCIDAPVTITGLGTFKSSNSSVTFHRIAYGGKPASAFNNSRALDFIDKNGIYNDNKGIFIYALGTNDMVNSNETPEKFKEILKNIATTEINKGNYAILWIPPKPSIQIKNGTYDDWKNVINDLAKELNCPVIDNSKEDFIQNNWYSDDGVHPINEGHSDIANNVLEVLN